MYRLVYHSSHSLTIVVLEYLLLVENNITGAIPSEIGRLTNLGTIGRCVVSYAACLRCGDSHSHFVTSVLIVYFEAHDNMLSGGIPSEISTLTNLGTSP